MNIQHVVRTGTAALSFAGLIGFALVPLAAAPDGDHDHDRVTLIGCMQPERGYHEGQWSGDEDHFVLANATPILAGQPVPSSIADESCDTATPGAFMYRLTGHGVEHLGQFVGRRVVIVGELKDSHWGHWDHTEIQGAMQGVWLRYFGKLPKVELGTIQEYVSPVTTSARP
jgi:hypothetical protein